MTGHYSPPGSVIGWVQEKKHFILIGSQHGYYTPWKDLFREVTMQAILFRRAIRPRPLCTRNPFARNMNPIPAPSGLILVPDEEYGNRVVNHLMTKFPSDGLVNYDFKVNGPRHQDDIIIATPSSLIELVESNKMTCTKVQVLLLCMLDNVLDENSVKKIAQLLPPKDRRSTVMYTNRLRQGSRNAMRVLLHSKCELIWIPQLIASGIERKTLLLQQYITESCQTDDRNDRVLVLCRTRKDAELMCKFVKSTKGTPGISYPSMQCSARQEKFYSFQSFVNPILFVGVEDIKNLDPYCVDCIINFNAAPDIWIIRQNARGRVFCK